MVLLVVDTQKLITNSELFSFERFQSNLKTLIAQARGNQIPVVYIRHDDGPGGELSKGTEGFDIYEEFAPERGEKIFDKHYNSAFKGTELKEYLRAQGINTIMIVGLQTDYCIDATIKAGFEHGFSILIPEYANTTTDNPFMTGEESYHYHNEFHWNDRYGVCITMEDAMKRLGS